MLKRWLDWLACVAIFWCTAALAVDRTPILLLGDDGNPPFSYAGADGSAQGVYADLLRRLQGELPAYRIELRPVPWKRALYEVEKGHADGMFPPYRKPELRPWMRYSEPLFGETVVVICQKAVAEKLRDATWPKGYSGLRIGNNAGFLLGGKDMLDMATAGQLTLEEAKSTENNLRKLAAGRIDCYPNERFAIAFETQRIKVNPQSFTETAVVSTEYGFVGFGGAKATGTPQRERFIGDLNQAIRKLRAEGKLGALPQSAL